MSNALTLYDMSPGLQEVVGCRHEPHQRKSRMVEISLSGSGEGPGWVTSRPTLQRAFQAYHTRLRSRENLGSLEITKLSTLTSRDFAEQCLAADCLQPPLLRRSGFRQQLKAGVRLGTVKKWHKTLRKFVDFSM